MKNYDVTALGELLIDFTENGVSGQGNPLFEANPGGAPCNVLAMLSKLGHKTAFIGKVGKDFFGEQLKKAVTEVGIHADSLYMDEEVHTTLALVHTYPDGDRDFSFYRNPGADMMLTEAEIPAEQIRDSRIFHFGTLSMTHEGVRAATRKAVSIARESGAVISFDPNLRPPLWKSLEDAREQVRYGLAHCDVLKISDNEIQWFTGEEDFDAGIEKLRGQYQIPLILLSMGKEGSRAYYEDLRVEAKPFLQENTVETTGAGDTFGACCLHYVLKYGIDGFDEQKLAEMLTFANAAASIITTRKGALRVMPSLAEIEGLLKKNIKLLLFDLDGTLLRSDKTISPGTLAAFRECREKGILIGVSTSRGEQNALSFIEELQPDVLIASGGALVKYRGEYIYKAEFSAEETRQMIAAARSVCGAECEITIDTIDAHYWNYKVDPRKQDQSWGDSIYTDFADFDESSLKMCVEIFDDTQAAQLQTLLAECDCIRFSDGYWYKFTQKAVTKERAIMEFCAVSGIQTAQIAAFGDDYADIGMLELCGMGIAMGNAIDAVKEKADLVIGGNDEDGIAAYLNEKYLK